MKKGLIVLSLLLSLLIMSCGSSKKNSTTAKKDYDLSKEVEFEKMITKEEMKQVVEKAFNYVIENKGYQSSILIDATRKNDYGGPYQSKIEQIYYVEVDDNNDGFEYGYIYEENVDNDNEIVEYFCKDSIVYYYNHNSGTKAIRENGYFTTYLKVEIFEFLSDLVYTENDQYGIDKNGNTVMISYCKRGDKLYEMRLVFKDDKLINYAYAWVQGINTYIDVFYKKSSEIKIDYPNLEEFD